MGWNLNGFFSPDILCEEIRSFRYSFSSVASNLLGKQAACSVKGMKKAYWRRSGHISSSSLIPLMRGVLDTTLCDKVC